MVKNFECIETAVGLVIYGASMCHTLPERISFEYITALPSTVVAQNAAAAVIIGVTACRVHGSDKNMRKTSRHQQASDTTKCCLERQKIFSYKLVLSDRNKFAKCKAERAGCPVDSCSACAVDTVRVLVREGSSDRMAPREKKEKLRCPKRGIAPACTSSLFSTLLGENNTRRNKN